ncbi:hypothetical protein J1N35_028992 [Gossypium stocksii]|uniref:S-protein homolog n=1 Tax=Gossypium stocksii TaxID=47602 RepID=A0A9D3UX24_9ROSI|nr:hypothetical protein J1N35_028992 [Gossypium stocksii]
MNPLPINWLLSLTLVFVVSEAGLLLHKTDVLIYNDLDGGTVLTLHCKSKNNDLGIQHLAYLNYFEFNFRPSLLGNTLFYCSMQWNGTMRWFDIYVESRDVSRCIRCLWGCEFKFIRVGGALSQRGRREMSRLVEPKKGLWLF